jgi:activator of HSP90 ATPase
MGYSRPKQRQKGDSPVKTKSIRQSAIFKAGPHQVYEMLMDSWKHSQITGAKAKISRTIGGKFTAYDGYISGVNIELIPDKQIVQSWRGSDWPEGHFSKATFSLHEVKGGTRLTFRQSGVPEDQYEDIKQGWRDYYWKPMRETLAEQ